VAQNLVLFLWVLASRVYDIAFLPSHPPFPLLAVVWELAIEIDDISHIWKVHPDNEGVCCNDYLHGRVFDKKVSSCSIVSTEAQ
jgi:hypothetical protein